MEGTFKKFGNKVARSIGLMHRAKHFLDKDSLLSLFFLYIHSHINYANLPQVSIRKANLKMIHSHQKHAPRITYIKDIYYHTKKRFRFQNACLFIQFNPPSCIKQKLRNVSLIYPYICIFQLISRGMERNKISNG